MIYQMTNAELRTAIDQCVNNIDRMAANQAAITELELHLEALLAVEKARAEAVEIPLDSKT